MANPKIVPALADLTQDIAGPVPLTLLQDWAGGRQDLAAAQALLDPFRIAGTVVASDTSGLSRMSDEMDLVEVISLISRPKEIIHALGVAVGGRAIGLWVADNTEMYYPSNVSEDDVVDAMWETQVRVASRNRVRIGMCIHTGGFYEIGGGLYGPDANVVERLAEDHASGGEILVTPQLKGKLSNGHYSLVERGDLQELYPQGVHALTVARGRPDLSEDRRDYPHAYTDEFIRMLNTIENGQNHDDAIRDIYSRFLRACAIVFVVRQRQAAERDMASMLDNLLTNALLETIVRESKPDSQLVTCGGGLALLTFNNVGDALDFATDVRAKFERNALPVKIGIDYGAILFFDRGDGRRNLVGDPANTASKISEDAGRTGKISITERAVGLLPRKLGNAEPFSVTISKVEIKGFWV